MPLRMLQNVRQSLRLLLKSPGATLAAVLSLALGIGANTTIFSLIEAVVLRPLPVHRSDRLVAVTDANELTVSYPVYRDLAHASASLQGLAAFAARTGSLTVGNASTVGDVYVVSGNYFSLLGLGAAHGRTLAPVDDRGDSEPVVVLSHAFWRTSLGGDPAAVGRSVLINGSPFTVAGVAPEGFRGTQVGASPLGWITLASWPRMATGAYLRLDLHSRGWGWLRMIGRMRDGVQPDAVAAELNARAAAQASQFSDVQRDFQVSVVPLRAAATGLRTRAEFTRFVALLVGVVVAVLGIACANVSGLLLARGLARRRELALRMALGASRPRVVGELIGDALVLAALGGVAGVLVAMWAIDLLQTVQLPGGIDMSRVDVRVSAFAVGVTAFLSLVAAIAFGLLPALHATRSNVTGSLKDEPLVAGTSRQFIRGALVAVQVTFSLVLLVGTALFARTLQSTLAGDLGFDPRNVAYSATNVSLLRYDAESAKRFYEDVLVRMREHPDVTAAAWTRMIPSGDRDEETVRIPGYASPTGRVPVVGANVGTSGYFEAMGIPILNGRGFSDEDASSEMGVAVVSREAANRFWNGDAIGRTFTMGNREMTVIGIARDVPEAPGAPPQPFVYLNALQGSVTPGLAFLVVRTTGAAGDIVPAIRDAIKAAGPAVPVLEARTMEDQLLDLLGPQRSAASLLGLLSVIALVLSAGGIYAMVAFWVTQRTREFGVRLALGASRSSIRRLAMRYAAGAVLVGLAAGLPLAIALGRASQGLLFGLSPADPIAVGGGVVVLFVTALLAGLLPAQRAARTNPLDALRAE